MSPETSPLPPVRKEIVVRCRGELAFELFTLRIGEWWPLDTHSVGQSDARGVTFEPRKGGRIFETGADGGEHLWGTVTRWDPPHGFECTWHPGREPATAQALSLRFYPSDSDTRVVLEHRGWEVLAGKAEAVRGRYDGGWEVVFVQRFAAAAEAAALTGA